MRGVLTEPIHEVPARGTIAGSVDGLPQHADLVVEALPENVTLKAKVLAGAEQAVSATTVLATNTSSLPVTELAASLAQPARFVGMHFFNPVPASELVEVVVAPETSDQTLRAAIAWTRCLGKKDIVVNDSPGFASSRLGLGPRGDPHGRGGRRGAGGDRRRECLGYKHPLGPLRVTDIVGLDVRLAIAVHLHATLGERFAPPRLLREKVARGELGRKTGRGFYPWP